MLQSRDEAKFDNREYEETRRQIEDDADRELLNMRTRHEHIVREEQVDWIMSSCHNSPVASPITNSLLLLIRAQQTCTGKFIQDVCVSLLRQICVKF